MKTVHKFPFLVDDLFSLKMPRGARVLMVDLQPGTGPCIWALVDTGEPIVEKQFAVTGTGHPIPPHARHVGSFQQPPFVWHLWEHES